MNDCKILDVTSFSTELRLLLDVISLNSKTTKNSINIQYYKELNWDHFIELVIHHRVYPTIYKTIKNSGEDIIPQYVVRKLANLFQKNTFKMLHLSAEMYQLNDLFTQDEIRTIFLKGPVLAREVYGDISLRTCGDLDILIPIKELEKADNILTNQGFIKDDYILTVLNDWKWRHHHVTYFHHEKGIKVEIHWKLNPGLVKEPSFNDIWERKRKSSAANYPLYCLGEEDLFLFLVSHGARHGWSRLRWLLDIHQLTAKELNWGYTIQLLKKYQCCHIAGQALILSNQLFNTKIPNELKPLVSIKRSKYLAIQAIYYISKMINLHSDNLSIDDAKFHKRHLYDVMTFRQKLLFIMSFLYPYPEDAVTLPLPKGLHFLYFPLRPLLWAWRKTRKQALT